MEDTSYSNNGYPPRSARILTRVHLVINYLFCLLYGLIGLEILPAVVYCGLESEWMRLNYKNLSELTVELQWDRTRISHAAKC